MSGAQPDINGLWTAIDRVERLRAERNALPLLSVRRWKLGRELRRAILQVPANQGRGR